mmetsp:Transcript_2988/g.8669  ORF Transcript_2988/g.8669 Transcript_2988/m.8669 type:complete len:226 (+) Transcript_2988:172-849(+)
MRLSSVVYCLVPPALSIGTEIGLGPGREHDLAILGHIAVGKGEGKGSGAANDGTGGGVLGSMAGAHELVVGGGPRDDAAKVGADGVEAVGLKGLVVLDDKVSGISLEALGEGAVTDGLLGKVVLGEKVVAKGVLGGDAASSAAGARGEEEGDVGDGKSADGNCGTSDKDQVHEVTTVLVDVELVGGLGHVKADGRAGGGNLSRGKGGGGASEGGEESGALDHGCY